MNFPMFPIRINVPEIYSKKFDCKQLYLFLCENFEWARLVSVKKNKGLSSPVLQRDHEKRWNF